MHEAPAPTAATTPPEREPAPAALVVDGTYAFGTYDGPIATINPLDVVDGRGARGRMRRAARNLRLKEWEAFQLGDDEWFVLGAVYDTKSIALLQVLGVHKASGKIHRWETKVPSTSLSVARGLDGTRSHGRRGDFSIAVGNEMGSGRLTVDASHPGCRCCSTTLPPLELHGVGDCSPDRAGHLVICHPFSDRRALYSHKVMMPFEGTMRIGLDVVGLSAQRSFMILDDHHGDYPSPMQYDWVTGVRRNDEGLVEGFNLTDNQIRDPHVYNENAVWRGNQVFRLPAVHMERPSGPMGTWLVSDRDGSVDVRFHPTVRSEMHVGPRRSLAEYHAPYGWYEGRIHTDDVELSVDGIFGVGEQKFIRV